MVARGCQRGVKSRSGFPNVAPFRYRLAVAVEARTINSGDRALRQQRVPHVHAVLARRGAELQRGTEADEGTGRNRGYALVQS
jgi:hypothetical protein